MTLVPVAEMCGKLKAAVDARRSDRTLILARTDAVAIEGLEAAFERAEEARWRQVIQQGRISTE